MGFDFIPEAKSKWVYSFIALQIPKCASSSIAACVGDRNLIQKHKGLIAEKFGRTPLYKGVFDTRHLLPSDIFAVFGRQVYDYFSFAVVREPIDRLVSSWKFGKKMKLGYLYGFSQGCSFSEYVDFLYESWENGRKDILILRPQTDWTHNSVFHPTTIIRYENLNSEWANMLEEYKIEGLPMELPWENRSEKEEVTISAATRKLILTIYQKDEILGYE